MTTEELTLLLARITVLDNRTVDALTIEAWEPIVGDMRYEDALEAVNAHFRESTAYLMPAHIVERATAYKRHQFTVSKRAAHVHTFAESGYCTGCGLRDDQIAEFEAEDHRRRNAWQYQ